MYYITVSNGLLSSDHKKRMGSAVWEFMWCIDKITRIDTKGYGLVLGGKPITLNEIGIGHDNTTSRNLSKLEGEGYIIITRTPHGLVIKVAKAKKRFNKNSESPKVVNHQKLESPTNNGESPTRNGESIIDITVDSTDDKTIAEASSAKLVTELIKLFEEVNPACKTMYGNTTQRKACELLIKEYGFDEVSRVIAFLPKSNKMPFVPTVTSPNQLWSKYQALKDGLERKKGELQAKGRGIA
jgi:hypothetical protein